LEATLTIKLKYVEKCIHIALTGPLWSSLDTLRVFILYSNMSRCQVMQKTVNKRAGGVVIQGKNVLTYILRAFE